MSNAQGIAFLSFGLIIEGSSGDFPSPYDVRFGVDNGEGDLGTLTSPSASDVRSGVQYGGAGTQYTGTLYIPGSSDGTWTEDALELWHDQVAEFGDEATYQGYTFDVIKNPIRSQNRMTITSYDKQADTWIDALRTDLVTNGLYALLTSERTPVPRPVVTVDSIQFEVLALENDDTTQPSVRMSCMIVK